jgi:hypothetical protein
VVNLSALGTQEDREIARDLYAAGVLVSSMYELHTVQHPLTPPAGPVLTSWLPRVTEYDNKMWLLHLIVNGIGAKAFGREVLDCLLDEFVRPDYQLVGCADEEACEQAVRARIGDGIARLMGPRNADTLLAIATDRKYGYTRQMIVEGLPKLRRPESTTPLLLSLLSDPEPSIQATALRALRRTHVSAALARAEELCSSENRWVRQEAERTVAALERSGPSGGQ